MLGPNDPEEPINPVEEEPDNTHPDEDEEPDHPFEEEDDPPLEVAILGLWLNT